MLNKILLLCNCKINTSYTVTDIIEECSPDNTLVITDNKHDTTKKQLRCKLIKFTDYELMKKCIEHIYKVNTVNK